MDGEGVRGRNYGKERDRKEMGKGWEMGEWERFGIGDDGVWVGERM